MYLLRGGFLDGYYGYVICKNSAFAAWAKYAKIRQYSRQDIAHAERYLAKLK